MVTKRTGDAMTVAEAVSILEGQFFCGKDQADIEVASACGSDLMSDVMAFVKDRVLLLTGLVNLQVIRTAALLDIHAIIFVRGKAPGRDMIDMAEEADIILAGTNHPMFISCGKLYEAGLRTGGTREIQGAAVGESTS
jgi:predicted transcriptional regulator